MKFKLRILERDLILSILNIKLHTKGHNDKISMIDKCRGSLESMRFVCTRLSYGWVGYIPMYSVAAQMLPLCITRYKIRTICMVFAL